MIPSYNYGRYLGDCLRSVFEQVGAPAFEIVVVDDGSTDDTMDVLHAHADPRLRVVRQDRNRGHAATINTALGLVCGQIVSRIDPDDRYAPHFMATTCAHLAAHPAAGLVYGRAAIIDAAGRRMGLTTAEPHHGDWSGQELVALLAKNFICAPTVAARREAWLAVPPVPLWLAFHDWYFTLLMARRWPFCFVDDVLADYRVHAANHHTTIAKDRTEERSVLWLLDEVYAEQEADAALEARKRAARRQVYASHFRDFADKYFGFHMNAEARRCYLRAVRLQPTTLADLGVVRRLLASMTSREAYERIKATIRSNAVGS